MKSWHSFEESVQQYTGDASTGDSNENVLYRLEEYASIIQHEDKGFFLVYKSINVEFLHHTFHKYLTAKEMDKLFKDIPYTAQIFAWMYFKKTTGLNVLYHYHQDSPHHTL